MNKTPNDELNSKNIHSTRITCITKFCRYLLLKRNRCDLSNLIKMHLAVKFFRGDYIIVMLICQRSTFNLSLEWDYMECLCACVCNAKFMELDWLQNTKLLPIRRGCYNFIGDASLSQKSRRLLNQLDIRCADCQSLLSCQFRRLPWTKSSVQLSSSIVIYRD